MNKIFNSKDMINRYIEFMNDELMTYNAKIFSHWSDLTDEMRKDFNDTFGEKNCKDFNYFIVIWSDNWMNWEIYAADDVFSLMEFANCIYTYYFSVTSNEFTEKLLQVQEKIIFNFRSKREMI